MSHPRYGASLLLGLAALGAVAGARADGAPPATPPPSNDAGPARPAGAQPPPKAAAPSPPAAHPKEAMALHDEAWTLYEQGRYRAAIERIEAALRIDPDGTELVYNLALLHEKLGDLKEAITHYRRYVEMETNPKSKARAQATLRRLEGAEREAASLPPVAPPAPAPPPPPPRRVRPAVVGAVALSGAALFVGTAFGVRALVANPGSSGRTGSGVTIADLQADAHAAHTDAVVADTSFVVSALAAGAALVLYYAAPRTVAALTTSSPGAPGRARLDLRPGAPGMIRVLF